MHRLGGFEAPPPIMSVYLGEVLTNILENIEKHPATKSTTKSYIDLGLNTIPDIQREDSDRNRTSPIAFTGNKFEFRAVGSSQSLAGPLMTIAAVWTAGIEEITKIIDTKMDATGGDIERSALEAISHVAKISKNIRFEGNSYSSDWIEEAAKRGLPVAETTYEALPFFQREENKKLLSSLNIMSEKEVDAYYEIRLQQFADSVDVEVGTLKGMMWEGVLPAISKQITQECDAFHAIQMTSDSEWKRHINYLGEIKNGILENMKKLEEVKTRYRAMPLSEKAKLINDQALPLMEKIREFSDKAERIIDENIWPYPKYKDLLQID